MQNSNSNSNSEAKEVLTLVKSINRMALAKNIRIVTAESCTGGSIAGQIVELAGVSAWFLGGIVAYANSVKQDLLKVKTDTLKEYGAVSEQTVNQMLNGACELLKADVAVAVSGIAGPDGGSPEKPVGTVFIGVGSLEPKTQTIKKYLFSGNRKSVQEQTKIQALKNLEEFLLTKFLLN